MIISPISGGRRRRMMDITLLFVIAVAVPAMMLRTLLRPTDPLDSIAVFYAPWISAADAATRATSAGASLLRFGAFDFIVVVKPDDPGYADRILSRGALFVLDPQFSALCVGDPSIPGASQ